jgi:hypothetical protein
MRTSPGGAPAPVRRRPAAEVARGGRWLGLALLPFAAGGCDRGEREMSANEVAAELQSMQVAPGLWETRRAIVGATGPNMPRQVQSAMLRRIDTARHCITPAEAAQPAASFLARQGGDQCHYYGFAYEGGRMRGLMRCTGGRMPGMMATRIDGRYTADRMDVRMTMEATGQPRGADATIETRISGRRIGDCPAAAPAVEERTKGDAG